jgi:prevent-host-death family protein
MVAREGIEPPTRGFSAVDGVYRGLLINRLQRLPSSQAQLRHNPGTPSLSWSHFRHCALGGEGWKVIADSMYSTYNPHVENSRESYMSTDDSVTVSAAEFHRNVGVYQDIALTKPVTITKNGRERTVLLSAQEYARLKRRDRRVIGAGELSEHQVGAIRNARVPGQYADLDKEIKN